MNEHDLTDYEQAHAYLNGCLYCDGGSHMGHAEKCPHGPQGSYVERRQKPGPAKVEPVRGEETKP